MTRRALLSLPFVAPMAKALGIKANIERNPIGSVYWLQGMPCVVNPRLLMRADPRCPKNSIEITRTEKWADAISIKPYHLPF